MGVGAFSLSLRSQPAAVIPPSVLRQRRWSRRRCSSPPARRERPRDPRFLEAVPLDEEASSLRADGSDQGRLRPCRSVPGHRVDPNARRTVLRRPGARHGGKRRFLRTVSRAADETDPAGHAVHADDAPAITLGHSRRESRDEIERCTHVDRERRVERVDGELRGRCEDDEARVVHQDADVADVLCGP